MITPCAKFYLTRTFALWKMLVLTALCVQHFDAVCGKRDGESSGEIDEDGTLRNTGTGCLRHTPFSPKAAELCTHYIVCATHNVTFHHPCILILNVQTMLLSSDQR